MENQFENRIDLSDLVNKTQGVKNEISKPFELSVFTFGFFDFA